MGAGTPVGCIVEHSPVEARSRRSLQRGVGKQETTVGLTRLEPRLHDPGTRGEESRCPNRSWRGPGHRSNPEKDFLTDPMYDRV